MYSVGGSDNVNSLIEHWNTVLHKCIYIYAVNEWTYAFIQRHRGHLVLIVLGTQTLMPSFAIVPNDRSETQAFEFCSFCLSFTAPHPCSSGGKL